MPVLSSQQISDISTRILVAAGASEANGRIVGDHLADANMTGHDSHGFIRVPQYVEDIQTGVRKPDAEPEIVAESGGILRVDGHHSFGQVVGKFATEAAIEKAKVHGISLATMSSLGHVGRIGSYSEMAARNDMAAIMFTGLLGEGSTIVPPYGGAARRFSTNPVSIGFPYREENPVLLDFATSIGAEGKLRVYRARGHDLPDEWVIDPDGNPSRDPNDFYAGGAILPLGGTQVGHKGYALAFMAAVLGGLVGEYGKPDPTGEAYSSGSTIIVIDISRLVPMDGIRDRVDWLVGYAKDTPLMPGFDEILYPGEKEATTRRARKESGVEIEEATWGQINGLMDEYGLD